MKDEIVEKVKIFINKHPHLKEESEVVYLMVELRKLLERNEEEGIQNNYPLIGFYADWVLHTKKDHITSSIKAVMNKVDKLLDPYPKQGDVEFLLMPEFKAELLQLLKENDIPTDFCSEREKWKDFAITLSNVLANQPIIEPIKNIKEFRYTSIDREHISANVEFNDNRADIFLVIAVDTF